MWSLSNLLDDTRIKMLFRFLIFGLLLFFKLFWSIFYFGIQPQVEYQVLDIKTPFLHKFRISKCYFDILISIFDI